MKKLTMKNLDDNATATVQHNNIAVKVQYEMPSSLLMDDMTEIVIEFKKDDESLLKLSKLLFTIEYLWNIDFVKDIVNDSEDKHDEVIREAYASLYYSRSDMISSKPEEVKILKSGFDLFKEHGLFVANYTSSYALLEMTSVSLQWFTNGVEKSISLFDVFITGARNND